MITVSQAIRDIIEADSIAAESLVAGLLNLSAYADKIQKRVEKLTFKQVKKGTIVVALSRISKNSLKNTSDLLPEVKIQNINLKSSLSILVYNKTADTQRRLATLHPFVITSTDLYSVVEGTTEISLICTDRATETIRDHMGDVIKSFAEHLVAISVEIDEKYRETPNVLYVLLSSLTAKRIKLLELIQTHTEITFLVEKKQMEEAMKILNTFS